MKINLLRQALTMLALAACLASCNKDLRDDIDNLTNRVSTLEESVDKLQDAIESGKLITNVEAVSPTVSDPGGWNITFSDNSSILVAHGKKGETGNQGETGQTPYMWINAAGNWATNFGSKPVDSDDAKYELKVNGQSVAAQGPQGVQGISIRAIDVDSYVAFQTYNPNTGAIIDTQSTNFPWDSGMIITAIRETDESYTFVIDGEDYVLARPGIYPTSITVIRDKEYVIKGGTVEFNIAVNPATSKVYAKEAFELDFEQNYARSYGVDPDFVTIKNVVPASIKGQYTMTLEWKESASGFIKDAAIFIVLNYTDQKGQVSQAISSTPVIMNEKYVSINAENVMVVKDIVMFSDETYTDSTRLSNYHPGYVNTVNYIETAIPNTDPTAINPIVKFLPADKYKFKVVPFGAENTTVWPAGKNMHEVNVKTTVTDYGRPEVPAIDAKPEIGQPAVPAIPEIKPIPIEKTFKVTVYKVPADGIIYIEDFGDRWIPNKTVDYTLSANLGQKFADNGYDLSAWNFAIKSQQLQASNLGTASTFINIDMDNNVQSNVTGFTANNYAVSYKLLPTIKAGFYQVILTITATPKTPRPAELKQTREFKVLLTFNVVAPKFIIYYNDGHNLIGNSSKTFYTYKLAPVTIASLFNVESNKNVSVATDVTPNADPLSYEYDMTDPRHGSQGVRFNPYPAVAAPTIADWGSSTYIVKPISVNVKLATGQLIPVTILCTDTGSAHSTGYLNVQYNRLNLENLEVATGDFAGNYNSMISSGINIAEKDDIDKDDNFTPKSADGTPLDPTMISSIVYSAKGNVQAQGGALPNGLAGKQILQINASGVVTSKDGLTWENPDAVLFQEFQITYTDIWGNKADNIVRVYVKSNSVPNIIP